jgi:replicative DNA helicase
MAIDSIALERQILGSVLNDPTLYGAIDVLRAEDIQDPACHEVWLAIQSLAHSAKPIDMQSVIGTCMLASANDVQEIARTGHVDRDRLVTAVTTLIDTRRTFALESELTRQIGALRTDGQWRRSISELLATLTADYGGYRSKSAVSTRQAALERLRMAAGDAIPTGLPTLDAHLNGGLRGSWLIGIGAFAKTGKTTLVATISGNLDQQKVPHQLFTLERHGTYIEELKAARELGVNVTQLATRIDDFERRIASPGYAEYIHSRSLTVEEIRHEILFGVRRKGIRVALIDYWQLIAPSGKGLRADNREEELSRQVQLLAATAVDAGIPIILTSQLNDNGAPRGSNSIKLAANLFLILHRDPTESETWLECVVTNITEPVNIGSAADPALIFQSDVGPYFSSP